MEYKRRLICIVGETNSGKDTIVKLINKYSKKKQGINILKPIVSYATRPKRKGEQDGVEHYFITPKKAQELLQSYRTLAYTKIEDPTSGKKGYEYFTLLESLDQKNTYIIDPNGIRNGELNKYVDTLVIYIHTPSFIRNFRARGRSDYKTKYKDRVLNEKKQFDEFRKNKEYDIRIENFKFLNFINIPYLYKKIHDFYFHNYELSIYKDSDIVYKNDNIADNEKNE